MNKDFDLQVLIEMITMLHAAMTAAPYEENGWIVLDNGGIAVEEAVDEILQRMEISGN